ncbi:MAG: hypothetical protein KC635_03645 [Myxococcales bacterium]|nr:hypothetical protein [Myxococcales bacterium]
MPRLAIPVTAVTLALAAAACASAPAASVDPATPAAAMGLARDHLVALRAAEARVHARVDAIRDVVRRKDPIAPWRELVCLEERVPAITAFANRGERAYTAFHAALDRGDADGALHVAVSAYQEFEDEPRAESALVETVQEWAEQHIGQELFEKTIQRLVELQTRFDGLRHVLHPLLATAYTAEGQRRLTLGDFDNARLDFLNALQYQERNETARAQLSMIHHNRAVDALEANDPASALEDATQAMRYLADPETSTLLVDVHTRLAQVAAQQGEWQQAQRHVQGVLAYGRDCDDMNFFTECIRTLQGDFVGYRRYDQAVALLEGAARIPHNRAIFDIENALASLLLREFGGRRG